MNLDIAGHNDRERAQTDSYTVPLSQGPFTIKNLNTDGWAVCAIKYNGAAVDLSACGSDRLWLDNPCEGKTGYSNSDGDEPCLASVTIDPSTLKPTNCPAKLVFHTCDTSYGGTDGALYYNGGSGKETLDNTGNDRERNQYDTYYVEPTDTTFVLTHASSDGWCVDAMSFNGQSISMSTCSSSRVWFDDPCSGSYTGECLAELDVDVAQSKVTNC
jgi:hypothetical protein